MKVIKFVMACVMLISISAVESIGTETVTPLSVVTEGISPTSVVKKDTGYYFVDFGKDAFAGLKLYVPSPKAGQVVTISLGEALSDTDTIDTTPPGSVRYYSTSVTLVKGQTTYTLSLTSADKRRIPTSIGYAMPFRYVEVKNAPSGFSSSSVTQIAVHYPFDSTSASFSCSNSTLTSIWDLCCYTMKATSFCGVFVDGDRERKPYEGDAYINQLGWFSCTTDTTLPRYSWEYLIANPTWPTEYILLAPILAWDDYCYTGDSTGLQANYAYLKARTLISLERSDGLISTGSVTLSSDLQQYIPITTITDLVDWPSGERDGYNMKSVNTVVNAYHCKALQCMANIAKVLGQTDDEATFETAAGKSTASLNSTLFNSETGLYIDGEGSTHSSMHANFFPLAFGLVPSDKKQAIAGYLGGRTMACSVYGAQFFMEALFDNGQADHAIALMTADNDRSWKHMLDMDTTMTYEAWDQTYKPNQDWNHAWGAAPANIIPRKLMGIEPLEPGFTKVLISPKPGSLTWADMTVPTVRGSIWVRFEKGSSFLLLVKLPTGTTAKIGIPTTAKDGPIIIMVDGEPAVGRVENGTAFFDNITSGQHNFVLETVPGPIGISNRSAYDSIISTASSKFIFKVWGKVKILSDDSFSLDDGSGEPITVVAPSYSGIEDGDYASVVGSFSGEGSSLVLNAEAEDVVKVN